MRAVVARDNDDARPAIDVYVHRLGAAIAAIRERTAPGRGFLGIALDADANANATADAEIGAPLAAVRGLVVTAREDLEVARQVHAALA
jgi:acetate kinase